MSVVAGILAATFIFLAVACVVLKRPLVPIPFGAGLGVDVMLALWPAQYGIAAVYNTVLGLVALMFMVRTSTGHSEIPVAWGHPTVLAARRRSRFVGSELVGAALFGTAGIKLHHMGFPLLAIFLECPASALLLRAAAISFVPTCRAYLVAVCSEADGIGNLLRLGDGVGFLPTEPTNLFHEEVLSVRVVHSIVGYCFGYAGLELVIQPNGLTRKVRLNEIGAIQLVLGLHALIYQLKRGRSIEATRSPFPGAVTTWGTTKSSDTTHLGGQASSSSPNSSSTTER